MTLGGVMIIVLKDMDKPSSTLTLAPRPQWIPDGILRLIDAIADHRRQPDHNQNVSHTLTKAVQKLLAVDTQCMLNRQLS